MKEYQIGNTVLTSYQIERGTAAVANRLSANFMGKDVVVITVVPGGILFTADLVRKLMYFPNTSKIKR